MIIPPRLPKPTAVTMCVWRRPEYAWESLASIASSPFLSLTNKIIVHVDGGGHKDMVHVLKSMGLDNLVIHQETHHIGCNQNTLNAIEHGFAESDYVVHVEEDVVLSEDAFKWFEWARKMASDDEIMTIHAWRHSEGFWPSRMTRSMRASECQECAKLRFFQPWGWATWKSRWPELKTLWPLPGSGLEWDRNLNRQNLVGLYPMISRAINIGWQSGIHGDGGGCHLDFWANQCPRVSEGFVLTDTTIHDYTEC